VREQFFHQESAFGFARWRQLRVDQPRAVCVRVTLSTFGFGGKTFSGSEHGCLHSDRIGCSLTLGGSLSTERVATTTAVVTLFVITNAERRFEAR
jgi:hypothetical protein